MRDCRHRPTDRRSDLTFRWRWALVALPLATASAVFSFPAARAPEGGIRCSLEKLQDGRSGIVAYTFFVPQGWKGEKALNWGANDVFTSECSAATPDRRYEVGRLETTNMTYSAFSGGTPRGLRLTSATDYLHAIVEGLRHRGAVSNVKVVDESDSDLPLLAFQKLGTSLPMAGRPTSEKEFRQTGFLKIAFEMNGAPETASLGTTVAGSLIANDRTLGFGRTASHFNSENGIYVVGPTLYVVAPSTPAAGKVKEAQLVASSIKMTPPFSLYLAKMAAASAQANLNATLARGAELRESMRQEGERSMANFRQRMADKDANTHDFCNYVLDQQEFRNRDGSIVSAPTTYSHAYVDNQGLYYLTNSPNLPSNQGYTPLQKTTATGRLHGNYSVPSKASISPTPEAWCRTRSLRGASRPSTNARRPRA